METEALVQIRHEHFEDGTNQTTITGGDQADAIFSLIMMFVPEDIYELETVGVEPEQDFEAA